MLVPFVIDADSLAPDPAWTSAQHRACHKSLLDVWQRIGLLAHDGDSFDSSRLKSAIQQLPQNLRPLWQEVLQRVPLGTCEVSGMAKLNQQHSPTFALPPDLPLSTTHVLRWFSISRKIAMKLRYRLAV